MIRNKYDLWLVNVIMLVIDTLKFSLIINYIEYWFRFDNWPTILYSRLVCIDSIDIQRALHSTWIINDYNSPTSPHVHVRRTVGSHKSLRTPAGIPPKQSFKSNQRRLMRPTLTGPWRQRKVLFDFDRQRQVRQCSHVKLPAQQDLKQRQEQKGPLAELPPHNRPGAIL